MAGSPHDIWDDPFEWTLNEHIASKNRFHKYIDEVEAACRLCFNAIADDSALKKEIPAPEEMASVFAVVVEGTCEVN